ncbi:MAG TPA: helix-turn-helix transcriptional regulator [Caulobacteraceae bacterium]|nr:helix-turn-helix transcriptional regulator [Caulobacteraceae bacterium]
MTEETPGTVHFFASADPHGCVAFLSPGVAVTLRAGKPELMGEMGATLGARLRRRRRELGLRQTDAAKLLGIDPKSLMWWERDAREPEDHRYPAIIAYLGEEPWPDPSGLGDQLRAERRRRGLSLKEAAHLLGVDEGTFWWWETERRRPRYPRTKALVESFLQGHGE